MLLRVRFQGKDYVGVTHPARPGVMGLLYPEAVGEDGQLTREAMRKTAQLSKDSSFAIVDAGKVYRFNEVVGEANEVEIGEEILPIVGAAA